MNLRSSVRNFVLTSSVGGLVGLGFGLGCVINANITDCNMCNEAAICHSMVVAGGCACEDGYVWSDPADEDNYDCDSIDNKDGDCTGAFNFETATGCRCISGYDWCNPADNDDLSCCEVQGGPSSVGSATGDDGADDGTGNVDSTGGDGGGFEPNPADCTPEVGGEATFCGNTDENNLEGSRYWTCDGEQWIEQDQAFFDAFCEGDNDFGYGCVDDGQGAVIICGDGPGTPCDDTLADSCPDTATLEFCLHGRLTNIDCATECMMDGNPPPETGVCEDNICVCCDFGQDPCPAV